MKALKDRLTASSRHLAALILMLVFPLAAAGEGGVNEAELRNLVLQDCGSCHGMTLQGGLGPALRPADLEHLSVAAVAALIRKGVPATAMPPWEALLSEPEIAWISEHLKSGALVIDPNP